MIELQSGQAIKLNFSTPSISEASLTCKVKRTEHDRISLNFPKTGEKFLKDLPEGKEIGVVVYTNSGIFVFDSIVINSPLEEEFIIEFPQEKKKIQRREYMRAAVNLQLLLAKDGVEYETRTINVGGGGIRFVTKDKLSVNERWGFSLLLPGEKVIKGTGKILYTLMQGQTNAGVITFLDINETERNRLIKLCFDEEIRNMKQRRSNEA